MFMKSSISAILIILSFLVLLDACKITVKLKSRTRNKFQIQIFVPALKQKTEKVTFERPGEKKVQVEGLECWKEHWLIRTWKLDADGNWVHALPDDKELKVKLEGNGWLRIMIDDDLKPWINERNGIFCSEGMCG
uniref:Uncharacterized protein n=1 Tax=Acrobeloides nanus TaxID=290746 RepID=A0A914C597_9BILA